MSSHPSYLAVDLGAGSGRVLIGTLRDSSIELEELHRFEETGLDLPRGAVWDLPKIYREVLSGMAKATHKPEKYDIRSVGIDTWGVDYGLIGRDGRLLGLPYQYRASRTEGTEEELIRISDPKAVYSESGVQFMFFNTLNQLLADKRSAAGILDQAESLLFMPDLIGYLLTGNRVQEQTIASTSQILRPADGQWSAKIIESYDLPRHLFQSPVSSGSVLGELRPEISSELGGAQFPVITVCGHDTASAVLGAPAKNRNPAYLSSGTWSLLGLELPAPILTEQARADAFTNELGYGGTIRFLKNLSGLWLIQQSRRYWQQNGLEFSYAAIGEQARQAEPFRSLIHTGDPEFVRSGRMPEKIAEFCQRTDQPIPETPGQVARCIYESLALSYRDAWGQLARHFSPLPDTLHIVGGGCQEPLLNQFTADALQITVEAGPVEATGLGNLLTQMIADEVISSVEEGRSLVRNSFPVDTYRPADSKHWDAAFIRWQGLP